jgi:hypothetical protein
LFLPFTVLPSSAQDATSGNLAIVLFGSDNATLGYARYEGTDNAGVPFTAYDDDGDGVAIAEGLATGQATAYQTGGAEGYTFDRAASISAYIPVGDTARQIVYNEKVAVQDLTEPEPVVQDPLTPASA